MGKPVAERDHTGLAGSRLLFEPVPRLASCRRPARMPHRRCLAADENDPPEGCLKLLEAFGSEDARFMTLSEKEGYAVDYDHIGMVVSKEAAREVWPFLADWMDERW